MGKRNGGWVGGLTNYIMILKGACTKHSVPIVSTSPYVMGEALIIAIGLIPPGELTKQQRIVWLYNHLVDAGYKRAAYARGKKFKASDFAPETEAHQAS